MSRLGARIKRLEERFGDCPSCAKRPALIEIVGPSRRAIPGADTDTSPCPDCGKPRTLISLSFAFDPVSEDGEGGSSPGSLQWEREQKAKR